MTDVHSAEPASGSGSTSVGFYRPDPSLTISFTVHRSAAAYSSMTQRRVAHVFSSLVCVHGDGVVSVSSGS